MKASTKIVEFLATSADPSTFHPNHFSIGGWNSISSSTKPMWFFILAIVFWVAVWVFGVWRILRKPVHKKA